MIDGLQLVLVMATALAATTMGGVFYAFSSFVMAGLRRLPEAAGMAAMQSVNVTAVRPGLMVPFFGTALGCVAVAATAISDWSGPTSAWLVAGSATYLGGVVVTTAACHVPRNDTLAATDVDHPDAASVWWRYLEEWTRWNHLRSLSGVAAGSAMTVAIIVG